MLKNQHIYTQNHIITIELEQKKISQMPWNKSNEEQNLSKINNDKQHLWTWIRFLDNGSVKYTVFSIRRLRYIKNNINRPTNWSKNNVKVIVFGDTWMAIHSIHTYYFTTEHSSMHFSILMPILTISFPLNNYTMLTKICTFFRHKIHQDIHAQKHLQKLFKVTLNTNIEALHANVQQYSIPTV